MLAAPAHPRGRFRWSAQRTRYADVAAAKDPPPRVPASVEQSQLVSDLKLSQFCIEVNCCQLDCRSNMDGQSDNEDDLGRAGSIAMLAPKSDRSEHRRYQADSKKHYDMLFKIVLTGDPNSGKSRILQRYMYGESSETKPTIGVEFTSKIV